MGNMVFFFGDCKMNRQRLLGTIATILILAWGALAVTPTYQDIPADSNLVLASGMADATGPGGLGYIEYWVWDGGNGYYYYTYRIHNETFDPFIKHLTIGNPTGAPYILTGSSGGGPVDGTAWTSSIYSTSPTLVDWVANDDTTFIYPDQSSWGLEGTLFQYASALAPSSAGVVIREGSLSTYANGLIVAPGNAMKPRSSGYWMHQYSGRGKETDALPDYMDSIEIYSAAFADDLAGYVSQDLAFGKATLDPAGSPDMLAGAKRQLFALWLNIVSQKVGFYASVAFDSEAVDTNATTIEEAVNQIETTVMDINATLEQLENVKDMAEILNCM